MKKQLAVLALLLSFSLSVFAQGIHFEDRNWKDVMAKAKKENKMVYVDVFTTWCGPCKMMEKNIFPQAAAGKVYNANFINYRIDAEKGEGLEVAKKYSVRGYPTNLFINPNDESVIFYTLGAPQSVEGFNENATIALTEFKDPMTWKAYTSEFEKGKRDQKFLKGYLTKANRLSKDNDAILDAYLKTIDTKNLTDSQLIFFSQNVQSLNNNAIPLLAANKERLQKLNGTNEDGNDGKSFFEEMMRQWEYRTFLKAVETKNEAMLDVLQKNIYTYNPEGAEQKMAEFKTDFYSKTGNEEGAKKSAKAEADLLLLKNLSDYKPEDEMMANGLRAQIESQLKEAKVPDSTMARLMEKNFNANAMALPSLQAANKLNNLAWAVYEDKNATQQDLKTAMSWSQKAMEFSKPYINWWAMFADTYAHLLYNSGNKKEAIKVQEEAVKKAIEAKSEEKDDLIKSLEEMKSGKL